MPEVPSSTSLAPARRNNETLDTEHPSTPRKKVVGCSEKLAGLRPKSPPILPPLVKTIHMPHAAMDAHIKRMYDEGIRRKIAARESPRKEAAEEGPPRVVRQFGEIEEIVSRLNGYAVDAFHARNNLMKTYMAKYEDHTPRTNSPERVTRLTALGVSESAKRLHDDSIKKQRESMMNLVQEYAPPIRSPRMKESDLKASCERLFSGKK
jgi:hypothetical protein